jgi:isocitrate dehydrogenase (NAD+)
VSTHKITLIPGDGIGPEVASAMVSIVEAAGKLTGATFDWHSFECGAEAYAKNGEILPQAALDSIAGNKVAIKGPTATPIGTGFSSINVAMRKKFDLYANFRPVKSLPGIKTNYPGIDLIIFRENTEDLYAGLELMINPDIAEDHHAQGVDAHCGFGVRVRAQARAEQGPCDS